MSQPVPACEPGLGDLSKLTAPAFFGGVKLMFVGVMNFSQIQRIMFVIVNINQSYSNNKIPHCEILGHILTNFWSY